MKYFREIIFNNTYSIFMILVLIFGIYHLVYESCKVDESNILISDKSWVCENESCEINFQAKNLKNYVVEVEISILSYKYQSGGWKDDSIKIEILKNMSITLKSHEIKRFKLSFELDYIPRNILVRILNGNKKI